MVGNSYAIVAALCDIDTLVTACHAPRIGTVTATCIKATRCAVAETGIAC